MKLLIFVFFISLHYSISLAIEEHENDGSITISYGTGNQLTISRSVLNPKKINILVSEAAFASKFQINEFSERDIQKGVLDGLGSYFFKNFTKPETTKFKVLAHLFRQFEGTPDKAALQTLGEELVILLRHGVLAEKDEDFVSLFITFNAENNSTTIIKINDFTVAEYLPINKDPPEQKKVEILSFNLNCTCRAV
ncbi:unnamed protein product [Phyllotreta striolata]|uniref:Uncharacterized protein n=1 Tax=Phyllotreta striolata TaxID=444603 RepID=A0A9N9XSZ8_PHYSR|nr:unnamed protein product [Phyllotreta striolata]